MEQLKQKLSDLGYTKAIEIDEISFMAGNDIYVYAKK